MHNIRSFQGHIPRLAAGVFIADTALIIGRVEIGAQSSIWFHSVLRGDINSITIGERSNLQDGTIVHVDYEQYSTIIEDEVTVGHHATIHGCTLRSRCLIGMGATILSGAEVQSGAIVAAGSVVREGQVVPERTLVAGVPAQPRRKITAEEWDMIVNSALHYVDYSLQYRTHRSDTPAT